MNDSRPPRFPMTFEQESMWLQEQATEGESVLLESLAYRLRGPLDVGALDWALTEVARRQAALRTRLVFDDDELVQVVDPEPAVVLHRRWCRPEALDQELHRAVRVPLDPGEPPIWATLIEVAADDFALVLEFHHSAVDDWSYLILNRELSELYRARLLGRSPDLPELSSQIGDFAARQRSAGIDPELLDWWRAALAGVSENDLLPLDRPRPELPQHTGAHFPFTVPAELTGAVGRLGRASRATAFVVYAAALIAALHGYSGDEDVIIGVPVSRRGSAAVEPLVGCLTDQMPVRRRVRPQCSFAELVAETKQSLMAVMARRDIPYAALLRAVERTPYDVDTPLCQLTLVLDDAPRMPLELPGIAVTPLHVDPGMSKFDMCMFLNRTDDGALEGFLEYADELFDRRTAARVAGDFVALLTAATAAPGTSVTDLLRQLPATPAEAVARDRR